MADVSLTYTITRGDGNIALMTICPSKRCLPANWHCIRDILRYRSLIENASARSARVVCSKQRNNVEDRWIWTNQARIKMAKKGWILIIDSTDRCFWIRYVFETFFDFWNDCNKFCFVYFRFYCVWLFFPIKRKSIVLIWNLMKYLVEKFSRKLRGVFSLKE